MMHMGYQSSHKYCMEKMFHSASSFNCELSPWNTSQVTNMYRLFDGTGAFRCHSTIKITHTSR